jgi:hypothetical protein
MAPDFTRKPWKLALHPRSMLLMNNLLDIPMGEFWTPPPGMKGQCTAAPRICL